MLPELDMNGYIHVHEFEFIPAVIQLLIIDDGTNVPDSHDVICFLSFPNSLR